LVFHPNELLNLSFKKLMMKNSLKKTILILLSGLMFSWNVRGQSTTTNVLEKTNAPVNAPQVAPQPPVQPLDLLTRAERKQVKAAHDAALQQDPVLTRKLDELKREREEVLKSLREAMIKADPSVEPLLDKMLQHKKNGESPKPLNLKGDGSSFPRAPVPHESGKKSASGETISPHNSRPGIASLTADERSHLAATREKVKDDPKVSSARDSVKHAVSPQDHQSAVNALRKTLNDAMIKLDPSIQPILQKINSDGVSKDSSSATSMPTP